MYRSKADELATDTGFSSHKDMVMEYMEEQVASGKSKGVYNNVGKLTGLTSIINK